MKDRSHPLHVAAREVIVDGDQVGTAPGERVEVQRRRGHQGLALAGLHLGDLALMQDDAADQLHVEMPQPVVRFRGLAHDGKGLRQDVVEDRARPRAAPFPALRCLRSEVLVVLTLHPPARRRSCGRIFELFQPGARGLGVLLRSAGGTRRVLARSSASLRDASDSSSSLMRLHQRPDALELAVVLRADDLLEWIDHRIERGGRGPLRRPSWCRSGPQRSSRRPAQVLSYFGECTSLTTAARRFSPRCGREFPSPALFRGRGPG